MVDTTATTESIDEQIVRLFSELTYTEKLQAVTMAKQIKAGTHGTAEDKQQKGGSL